MISTIILNKIPEINFIEATNCQKAIQYKSVLTGKKCVNKFISETGIMSMLEYF